jgi:tRNA-specific 2-thiouridylase
MKCAVLVSGGVDSSVALRLAQQQGHNVTAFYLKIWLEDELSFLGTCPWEEDLQYVRAVCEQAHVPLEVISFQHEYWDIVVSYVLAEVQAGRTPNPDVLCNQHIKFGAFTKAIGHQFDKIVTGHYAQIISGENGLVQLGIAPDPVKDQTYFLSALTQEQLQRAWFPIGHYTKSEVRSLAQTFDLPNKARKDSQGICFLGKLKFNDFLKAHLGERLGPLREYETGILLGEHKGFWYHTIGQRQGLGLSGGPWYVVAKSASDNTVFISRNYYAPEKERNSFFVQQVNWISGKEPELLEVMVKLRHGPLYTKGTLVSLGNNVYQVLLDSRDQGIAPGQFAVFYQGNICLGSGKIAD